MCKKIGTATISLNFKAYLPQGDKDVNFSPVSNYVMRLLVQLTLLLRTQHYALVSFVLCAIVYVRVKT